MYIFIPNSDVSNRIHAIANKGIKYLWPYEPNHRFNSHINNNNDKKRKSLITLISKKLFLFEKQLLPLV